MSDLFCKMARSKFREKILEVSGGAVAYLADLLLFMITYGVELSTSGYGGRAASRAYARTMQELYGIEKKSTSRELSRLKGKGYIKYSKERSDLEITATGRRRLRRAVPVYEKRRKWDGKLYLITYDIPEHKKMVRDRLRDWLKALGCGMLQRSIWITPYDPREVLRKYIRYNRLEGEVLISYTDKDGAIAGKSMKELLAKVYRLDELNRRYKEFLKQPLEKWPGHKVAFEFYPILKDDPQLPFGLLPDDWKGDEAFKRFSSLLTQRSRG